MVLGTTSGAGKSWLVTALCRWYARQGLRVAPFKAQNMSNNARVVAGGEIGSAQYFQALAARVVPAWRMNPVLLKPESDTHSQVVAAGAGGTRRLSGLDWRSRCAAVWPAVCASLDALRAEHDVVVIEGAGSPAEINLADCDIVNMRVAAACTGGLPAGHRHRPRRCLRASVRNLGAAASAGARADPRIRAEQVPRRPGTAGARSRGCCRT
jgi:adenosylcobyric acid synthase